MIRSKGLFWVASRPEQALVWGQAGGSLRADSAGVWWSSMSYDQRMQYGVFVDNQELIEKTWDASFGDRKNEIVFIGQNMDEEKIRLELESCLMTEGEMKGKDWKTGYEDEWPVQRIHPVG